MHIYGTALARSVAILPWVSLVIAHVTYEKNKYTRYLFGKMRCLPKPNSTNKTYFRSGQQGLLAKDNGLITLLYPIIFQQFSRPEANRKLLLSSVC